MKKRLSGIIALLLLVIAFLVIRFPLLNLHGMKDWPLILFIISATICFFAIIFGANALAVTTTLGYIAGFIFGYFFQETNVETGQNSLWFIWTIVLVIAILIGIIIVIYKTKKAKRKNDSIVKD